jgi:hypothetical protein
MRYFHIFMLLLFYLRIVFSASFENQTLFCETNNCLSNELLYNNAIFYKTVIEFGFCDIPNYQGHGKCY